MKTKQLLKEIKGVFVMPVKHYYFTFRRRGCPYFMPDSLISVRNVEIGWKDKFGSPRHEWPPQFHIYFFGLQFSIYWYAPFGDDDQYYEQILWWMHYADKDINKARKTWPWTDMKTNKSTWDKSYER